ncbi:hypothetical protein AB0A76_28695 [Streptomyces exfoliatus]|uniref:Uncharacterized protein n=1 Tax=Streptomyces exfoliatus TaxID=1905 RepID=A0ABV3D3S6_STREX
MTSSCALYREGAESALAALAETTSGDGPSRTPTPAAAEQSTSPLKTLTKMLALFRSPNR